MVRKPAQISEGAPEGCVPALVRRWIVARIAQQRQARSDEQQRGEHGNDAPMLIAGRIEPEERRRRGEPHPALRRQRERGPHEDKEKKAARSEERRGGKEWDRQGR